MRRYTIRAPDGLIEIHDGAGHQSGFFRGQESYCTGNFGRIDQPSERLAPGRFIEPVRRRIVKFALDAILAVRLKVVGKLITESEVMVSREGDFGLFNTDTVEAKPVFGQVLPVEDRVPRARLKAIAESYFQGITREDPTIVPFHPDCNRVENGVQTTNSPPRMLLSCYESLRRFKYMSNHRETRFPVVDAKRGLVLGITAFDMPVMRRKTMIRGRPHEISPEIQHLPRTMFLYELFKVDGGKIRQIEAVMRNEALGTSMGWSADR